VGIRRCQSVRFRLHIRPDRISWQGGASRLSCSSRPYNYRPVTRSVDDDTTGHARRELARAGGSVRREANDVW